MLCLSRIYVVIIVVGDSASTPSSTGACDFVPRLVWPITSYGWLKKQKRRSGVSMWLDVTICKKVQYSLPQRCHSKICGNLQRKPLETLKPLAARRTRVSFKTFFKTM